MCTCVHCLVLLRLRVFILTCFVCVSDGLLPPSVYSIAVVVVVVVVIIIIIIIIINREVTANRTDIIINPLTPKDL
jgi:hypothetical protein